MAAENNNAEALNREIRLIVSSIPVLLTILFIALTISSSIIMWSYYHVFGINIQEHFGIKEYFENSLLLWIVFGVGSAINFVPMILDIIRRASSRSVQNTKPTEVKQMKSSKRLTFFAASKFELTYALTSFLMYLIFISMYFFSKFKAEAFLWSFFFFLALAGLGIINRFKVFAPQIDELNILVVFTRSFYKLFLLWIFITGFLSIPTYLYAYQVKNKKMTSNNCFIIHLNNGINESGILIGRSKNTTFILKDEKVIFINRSTVIYEETRKPSTLVEIMLNKIL